MRLRPILPLLLSSTVPPDVLTAVLWYVPVRASAQAAVNPLHRQTSPFSVLIAALPCAQVGAFAQAVDSQCSSVAVLKVDVATPRCRCDAFPDEP